MPTEPASAEAARRRTIARDAAMVGLAIASILILAAQEYRWVDAAYDQGLLIVDLVIVAVFWVEYLARLRRHPDKAAFIRANWYELPGMVPILPGMERFASVRLFRLLRLLRILRLLGALRRFEGFERFVERFIRRSKLGYVALLAAAIVAGCAALAWTAEPQTFPTYWDALWWGVVTATTVGYGDFFPRTGAGRLVGVVLMLLGVGLIGTFAGTLSSFLVERGRDRKASSGDAGEAEPTGASPVLPVPGVQLATELERLARLRDSGRLSEEEYAAAKRRLLE